MLQTPSPLLSLREPVSRPASAVSQTPSWSGRPGTARGRVGGEVDVGEVAVAVAVGVVSQTAASANARTMNRSLSSSPSRRSSAWLE